MAKRFIAVPLLLVLAMFLGACSPARPPVPASPQPTATPAVLRLATTTSTEDSGLLDAILPDFEALYHARVDVVAVGTGQALALGAKGDADVVLVHAKSKEEQFVADGDGAQRFDVMYNDFVIVGPKDDPAGISALTTAKEAFARIASHSASFISRGDDSGTHSKEKAFWVSAEVAPDGSDWYFSIGQGMGETLLFANEKSAYTLTDRGTWLSQRDALPNLALLVGGNSIADNEDAGLLNLYGVIPVNPAKHPGVNSELANRFVAWITSEGVQQKIAAFGAEKFGQALFYPNSAAWQASHN